MLSARRCAANYLQTVAGEFPEAASACLLRAGKLYQTMTADILVDPSLEVAPCPLEANRAYAPEWPKECRLRQVDILEAALDLERQAIAEIEHALAVVS